MFLHCSYSAPVWVIDIAVDFVSVAAREITDVDVVARWRGWAVRDVGVFAPMRPDIALREVVKMLRGTNAVVRGVVVRRTVLDFRD